MTPVKFNFEIGHYNGTMSLDIVANGRNILHKESFESDRYSFTTEIEWPCLLELKVGGKNQNQDTLIDESGQVIKDKYIKLKWGGHIYDINFCEPKTKTVIYFE